MNDTPARFFYVSAIDDNRKYLAAGPYDTHAEAIARVEVVRERAYLANPWSHFYKWGTAGSNTNMKTAMGKV